MRNWFDTGCDCSNPEPIVGAIVGGKKFPFGTVKQSDYNADMEEVNNHLSDIDERVADNKKAHDIDINNISQRLSLDEQKLESVASNVLRNNDEISNTKSTVSALNTILRGLTMRVDTIEDKLDSIGEKINEISANVDGLNVHTSALDTKYQSSIGNINASIKSITDVTGNLDSRVTALEKGSPEPEPPTPVDKFFVYWGASLATSATPAVISNLAFKEYTDTIKRTINVPSDNEYVYYAYPTGKGYVQFEVTGNTGGFGTPVDVPVSDAEGNTTNYTVYRSNQLLDNPEGIVSIKVK